jgi:hypothetical protein
MEEKFGTIEKPNAELVANDGLFVSAIGLCYPGCLPDFSFLAQASLKPLVFQDDAIIGGLR